MPAEAYKDLLKVYSHQNKNSVISAMIFNLEIADVDK